MEVKVESMLSSLKEEMNRLEKEFKDLHSDLSTLEQNYISTKKQLETKIEQVRGAYTALSDYFDKYAETKNEPDANKVMSNTTSDKTTSNKKQAKKTEKESTQLTTEQIEQIKKIIPETKEQSASNVKAEDIPDYLKNEYNTK